MKLTLSFLLIFRFISDSDLFIPQEETVHVKQDHKMSDQNAQYVRQIEDHHADDPQDQRHAIGKRLYKSQIVNDTL